MTDLVSFRVWAPRPKSVELVFANGERLAMRRGDGGYWTADVATPPDAEYGFSLDGGQPLPDPRSGSQPNGVHALSRRVDHKAFQWTDRAFSAPPLENAVIYELHVGTFTEAGTFEGAIERLDYLRDLGVTHVEIMPVNEFSGSRGWGYDGVDLFAPHHAYGGPTGLKRLVDACHARGLAAVLDVVYNHLGPAGNYLEQFGPYFTDRYHTPWGKAVNLDDCESDEVRRFFCDNALMWLRDYHFDGLRLDAVHAFADHSAVHFLEQLAKEVADLEREIGRRLVLIAESDLNDPRVVRPPELGGYGIDAQWSDDFHHAIHTALTGERTGYYADFDGLVDIAKCLESVFVYDGRYCPSRRRRHGRPPVGLSGNQFLGYAQNHDQIGNRARGERLSHLVDQRLLFVSAALVLTAPFVPMLFQGEEWGASTPFLYFTDHEDPGLATAVRDGRRREFAGFGWKPEDIPDPQDAATFRQSVLRWEELTKESHARLLEFYRRLIDLRRRTPSLSDGRVDRTTTRVDEQRRWLVIERGLVTIALNVSDQGVDVPLVSDRPTRLLLASDETVSMTSSDLQLPAMTVAVLGP
jgi:maltooligosyltrehalose trehalohydrolase